MEVNEINKKMTQTVEHLQKELRTLRTGRANPGMLDGVQVEVYGTGMRLKDIASVSVPEARILLISPFDANNCHAIVKAIDAANLNVRATVDGNIVRVQVPEMDNSVRQEMVKQAKKIGEDCKVKVRNIRREGNDCVRKEKSEGIIAEDVMKSQEKKIQEFTDKQCKAIDELTSVKEKEILTI